MSVAPVYTVIYTPTSMALKILENIKIANEEQKQDTWSNLPTLLVWMINARLDYPNKLRFAAVCKSWQLASSTYPSNHQSGMDALPWIMITRGTGESKLEFISTLTEEKYTIDLPDFCHSRILFSKQGWLLLLKMELIGKEYYYRHVDNESDPSLFLLNPFTKVKIKLPYIDDAGKGCAAFTVVDGNPHRIILLKTTGFGDFGYRSGTCIYLHITDLDDNEWTLYSYRCWEPRSFFYIGDVVIVGQLVYCLAENARVFIFYLANSKWSNLLAAKPDFTLMSKLPWYVMEREGEIWMVHFPGENGAEDTSMFYRLNGTHTDWEAVNTKDLKDAFWFLGWFGSCTFELKEKGMDKFYSACRNLERDGYVKFDFYESNNMGRLILEQPKDKRLVWFDMG